MKNLFLIVLCIFVIDSTLAQHGNMGGRKMPQDGIISGTIVNDKNKPVEFASVSLMSVRDSSIAAGSMSNSKGEFKFSGLKMGIYSMKIKLLGFKAKKIEPIYLFPKGSGKDRKGKGMVQNFNNVKLTNSDIVIEDVSVIADKSHVQYKLDKKIVNVSQDISSGGGSAVDVLENTPSVTVDIDGNVQLRGSSNFTVLIDGKPTVLDANDALQQIPAGAIKNIEIITNPSAKFDPDGAAGIINIVMKKKKKLGLNGLVQVSVGTREKYKGNASFSYRVGKVNLFAGFDYQDTKNFGKGKVVRKITNNNSEFFSDSEGDRHRARKGMGAKGGFDYYINDKNTLSISGSYSTRQSNRGSESFFHEYQKGIYDHYYMLENKDEGSRFSYDVNADYSLQLKENQKLETSLQYSSRNGEGTESNSRFNTNNIWKIIDADPILTKANDVGPRSNFRYRIDFTSPIADNGSLETGYQLRYDVDDEDYTYDSFDNTISQWVEDKDKGNKTSYTKHIQALYLTYANKIWGFDYKLGLRTEYMDRTLKQITANKPFNINRFDFFPSAYITRKLGRTSQIQLNYSRRVNRPRGRQLDPKPNYHNPKSIRKGNPYLKPEYVDSYELNFQKHIKSSFLFLETYYRKTNDLINFALLSSSADTVILTYDNINTKNTLGVEVGANIRMFHWWRLSTSVNGFYFNMKGDVNQESVDKESFSWTSRLNSTFTIKKNTKIQLNVFYMAPSKTAQGERDAFLFSNIAVQQSFLNNKLKATLKLSDIFNTMRHKFNVNTPSMQSEAEFSRKGQILMLTLSYTINNYKQKRERSSGEREDEGMEMSM